MDVNQLLAADADVFAVACNYREATKAVGDGARAYLLWTTGGNDYIDQQVLVRSRGGRWIAKWERTRRLTNFRSVTLPNGNPLRARTDVELYPNRAAADARAAEMQLVSRREATHQGAGRRCATEVLHQPCEASGRRPIDVSGKPLD